MAVRWQNSAHPHGRTPSYYANHNLYPGSYTQPEAQTRISRRIHDGFVLNQNFGLDTTSDDVNSSPYSSPYYINGRYNSDNLTTQRANSASVQGTRAIYFSDEFKRKDDIVYSETAPTIELWQGKQIRFEMPYNGKVVGNTIILKNSGECTGILSIYFSDSPDGRPLYETAIDLCKVSPDRFEKFELYSMTVVPRQTNPKNLLYVRMEIWDEVDQKRSRNPFNTGRKIEIMATGLSNHEACVYKVQNKNVMVTEKYDYKPFPSRPALGLIYSDWDVVPVDRLDEIKSGASVSYKGRRYDLFCVRKEERAFLVVYDTIDNKLVKGLPEGVNEDTEANRKWDFCPVDPHAEQINIAQVTLTQPQMAETTMVYFVDGYSPLRSMQIGHWQPRTFEQNAADGMYVTVDNETWFNSDLGKVSGSFTFTYRDGNWYYNDEIKDISTYGIVLEGGNPANGATINIAYTVTLAGTKTIESAEYVDARPVVAASLILYHNNRVYLSGFRNDPNLVQCSTIEADGPDFENFPYRWYTPNRSPYDTSLTPIVAMVEYTSDQIMFIGKSFFSIFKTYSSSSAPSMETGTPTQVSTYIDSAGIQSQGDVCNYKGVIYSYDQKEGIRRYSGATWSRIPNSIDSHYDRVDMKKPRKMWGFANKLYFNYYDSIDGRPKCLVWDMMMNYQQYPWFQDVDIPFCDVRTDDSEEAVGLHPDYPMIMQLYAEDTWRRLDTPIMFRRDTKFLNLPGNASDFTVNRFHLKILNNANRWWYISLVSDKQNMTQFRGHDSWYREPAWDTITVTEPIETPFPFEDTFEENAIYRISILDVRIRASAIQARIMTKTFRNQADLVSTEFEVCPKQFL